MYYILHLSAQIASQLSPVYIGTCFYLSIWHFKNHSGRKVFRNLNLGNLENVLTKKCRNRRCQGVHFQSIWRHKFSKFVCLAPTMVLSSCVWWLYLPAQKNSGYIPDTYKIYLTFIISTSMYIICSLYY